MNNYLNKYRLLQLIFPARCIFCNAVLPYGETKGVCSSCFSGIFIRTEQRCRICSRPMRGVSSAKELCDSCLEHGRTIHGHGSFAYEDEIRTCIQRYKYEGKKEAAPELAAMMYEEAQQTGFLQEIQNMSCFLTYVPVHDKRKAQRGFDQSELLARFLAKRLHVPLYQGLMRKKNTIPLKNQGARERQQTLQGAFSMLRSCPVPEGTAVIVDDIYTSGSTIETCAEVIRQGNPQQRVIFWTFAIRPEGEKK